jgi:hypothetical protein
LGLGEDAGAQTKKYPKETNSRFEKPNVEQVFFCVYDPQPGRLCMTWIKNPIPGFGSDG